MIAPWLRGELEEEEEHMQGSLTGEKNKENRRSLERSLLWYFQNILTILIFLPLYWILICFLVCFKKERNLRNQEESGERGVE